jgi:hypothetical protein
MTAGRKKNRKIRSEKTITPPQKQIKEQKSLENSTFSQIIPEGKKDVNSREKSDASESRVSSVKSGNVVDTDVLFTL